MNKYSEKIYLFIIPGLMLCLNTGEAGFRLGWQLALIWFCSFSVIFYISCIWLKFFFFSALISLIVSPPVQDAYITFGMLTAGIFLIQGYARIDRDRVLDAVCLSGFMLALWIIGQHLEVFPYFYLPYGEWSKIKTGPFNPDAASVFLALTAPAFYRASRLPYIAPVLLSLYLCGSITGILAFVIPCYCFSLSKIKYFKLFRVSIYFFVIFLAVCMISEKNNGRWYEWGKAVMMITEKPAGYGPGSYKSVFQAAAVNDSRLYNGKIWYNQAHNEYIQAAFEFGLLSLFFVSVYLIIFFAQSHDPLVNAGMLALAIGCAGWCVFHVAPSAVLGTAWIGLSMREKENG